MRDERKRWERYRDLVDCVGGGMTYAAAAERHGISATRVKRLIDEAVRKIHRQYRDESLYIYGVQGLRKKKDRLISVINSHIESMSNQA